MTDPDTRDPVTPDFLAELRRNLADTDRLRRAVAQRPGGGGRPSAVLALVGPGDGDGPDLLFIERAVHLRSHAGQIAFPGGGWEAGDADAAATALRETQEETGVDPSAVQVLGALPPAHVAASGFDVTAVIGWWLRPGPVGAYDPGEVAAVHRIPIAELMDPINRASAVHPSGYVGPAFTIGELFIWGLTAHFVDAIGDLAGWTRPWDRGIRLPIPDRFTSRGPVRRASAGPDAH